MALKEISGMYYGADFRTGTASSENSKDAKTTLVCDDLGNNAHYVLSEVNVTDGAVVQRPDGRYKRVNIEDWGEAGVQVFQVVNDNPAVGPGEALQVQVGSHTVEVHGTAHTGVTINGQSPQLADEKLRGMRYPRPQVRR
ncbi:hypothetical protein KA078_00485 [Candidatus Woesebacteria bacterium]|nr:hypothetical protein [Candidatus Woesebacteria bacterium]